MLEGRSEEVIASGSNKEKVSEGGRGWGLAFILFWF